MNRRRLRSLCLLVGLMLLPLAALAAPAAGLSPLKTMRVNEGKVRAILATPVTAGSPQEAAKKERLKTTVNTLFNYRELARRALDRHWETIDEPGREKFVATLKALIEKSYLLKITTSTTYQAKFGNERYTRETSEANVDVKIKSGKYRFNLTFSLMRVEGAWFIYDMVIDDVSLIQNYRTQFNKVITKDGFDELLKRMRDKLNE